MAGFFGLFDYSKPGRGISKDEPAKTGVALYFDIFLRRIWKIMAMNIFYIIASFPAIIVSFFIAEYFLGNLVALSNFEIKDELAYATSLLLTIITIIVLQITGSGPASVGMNYVLRKYVNDTHSWVWSDFIENIKKNFKQGIGIYLVNVLMVFLFMYGFLFYTFMMKGTLAYIMRTVLIVFAAVFMLMQKYTYMLVSGFEVKFKHIYKNALILTLGGMKQNILSAAVVLALMYVAFYIMAWNFLLGALVIIFLYFSVITFTQIFITNNVIKKLVILPMEDNKPKTEEDENTNSDFNDAI